MKIVIGYLYADLMNIYGDTGNITALQKRAIWRGIEVEIKIISLKDKISEGSIDLYFFGGGQDLGQKLVSEDLQKGNKAEIIKNGVERGVPLLAICGGYQLLSDFYQPAQGIKLPGIGLFPVHTIASNSRMIGNIVIKINSALSDLKGKQLVGFENHSGKTYLNDDCLPLGKVIKGSGNNGEDKTEGCIYKNAIGCYMHGSLLPKNPHLADWLLKKALEIKYGKEVELTKLDDKLELSAHKSAIIKFS